VGGRVLDVTTGQPVPGVTVAVTTPVMSPGTLPPRANVVTDFVNESCRHGIISCTVRYDGGDPVVAVVVIAFRKKILGFRTWIKKKLSY
jgi:hypothetical protein